MNKKQNDRLPHGEELPEIELSAEQLLSLFKPDSSTMTAAPAVNLPVSSQAVEALAKPAVASQAAEAPTTTSATSSHASAAAPRELGRWKSALAIAGMGSALAVAAAIGYEGLRPPAQLPPLPPPVAEVEPAPPPVAAPVSDQPPVLVRNPFDKSEVFEFPAGTTTEEAKAAVADALLERARVRQAEYDAKHPKRRRSRPG
jgi:hypothetical protein